MIDNDDDKFEQFPPIEGNPSSGIGTIVVIFIVVFAIIVGVFF